MTESSYAVTEVTGRFGISISLDQDDPEPIPHTCQRVIDDLTAKGLMPGKVLVADISATKSVGGVLQCSVSWVAMEGAEDV